MVRGLASESLDIYDPYIVHNKNLYDGKIQYGKATILNLLIYTY